MRHIYESKFFKLGKIGIKLGKNVEKRVANLEKKIMNVKVI
jgi:hypothetical protein